MMVSEKVDLEEQLSNAHCKFIEGPSLSERMKQFINCNGGEIGQFTTRAGKIVNDIDKEIGYEPLLLFDSIAWMMTLLSSMKRFIQSC